MEQGEVISIIGPSGSGKSTLLRCINQFEKIDSGECEICGITMTRNDENGKAVYADNKTLHDIRLKTLIKCVSIWEWYFSISTCFRICRC